MTGSPAPALVAGTSLRAVAEVVARHLATSGIDSPAADARWLIEGIVGSDPHRQPDVALPAAAIPDLRRAVERRAAREPLQLILGRAPFRSLELLCRPGVFVPRPETEVVAGLAIDAAARVRGHGPIVVEPCTGTGAIALSIVAEVAGATVVATDRDAAAVDLARDNAARLRRGQSGPPGFAPGATLLVERGDLLEPVPSDYRGHLDVLVANPPYLPSADRDSWSPEVADHDPIGALVGGTDGHEVVDALLLLATSWLGPGGVIVLEIDERRGAEVAAAARMVGFTDVEVARDLTGADRALVARRSVPGGDHGDAGAVRSR